MVAVIVYYPNAPRTPPSAAAAAAGPGTDKGGSVAAGAVFAQMFVQIMAMLASSSSAARE